MDTESLKSIGVLLLWGGFFYFMMRYGCGGHMLRGHAHGHGGTGAGRRDDRHDPVCGMTVNVARAAAAAVHSGQTYYFCSTACRDRFEQGPEQFIGASPQAGQGSMEQHHG